MSAFEFVAAFFLAGEDEAVFGGEKLLALAEDGVADEGVVLVGAEEFIPAMMWDVARAKLGPTSREQGCGSSRIDSR